MKMDRGLKILILLLVVFLLGYFSRGPAKEKPDGLKSSTRRVEESAAPSAPVRFEARVARVIDGDTIVLADGRHVRYLGINSPELRERWGEAAKKFNSEMVLNKTVGLEMDKETRDAYRRTLAYIFVDGVFVNERLVEEGLAKTYFFATQAKLRYQDQFLKAEDKAREDHNGVWLDEWEREVERRSNN